MTALVTTAFELQKKLDAMGLPSAVIGGLAYLAWGEPRLTKDVDLAVLTALTDEDEKIDQLLTLVSSRIADPQAFARLNRVILGQTKAGVGVDIGLAAFDYEVGAIERAVDHDYGQDMVLRVIRAEDLIVQKAFASRDQDWLDIRWVLIRQEGKLDWSIVNDNLPALVELKEEPEILTRLQALRDELC